MPSQWFDAKDETKVTREAVNTYIEFRLKQYYRPHFVMIVFHEDFENWIDLTFSKADSYILYDLRDYLRQNGIFVETGRGKPKVLKEEPHIWTPAEVKDQTEKSALNSRWNKPKTEVQNQYPSFSLTSQRPSMPFRPKHAIYTASPRVDDIQRELKPRYRQSRNNDDKVREGEKRQKEP
ncbi:hypothetical protein HI914_07280, partial [Erysiphe necator]